MIQITRFGSGRSSKDAALAADSGSDLGPQTVDGFADGRGLASRQEILPRVPLERLQRHDRVFNSRGGSGTSRPSHPYSSHAGVAETLLFCFLLAYACDLLCSVGWVLWGKKLIFALGCARDQECSAPPWQSRESVWNVTGGFDVRVGSGASYRSWRNSDFARWSWRCGGSRGRHPN